MKKRRIIFLGIDGVLNDYSWKNDPSIPWIMETYASQLNYLLSAVDAQIILSSQRRRILHLGYTSISGFRILLNSHGIYKAVMAGYLPYTDNWKDKGFLINDWLRTNIWDNYVVLDMSNLHIKNQIKFETPGLTEEHVRVAIDVLLGFNSIESDVINNNLNSEIDLVD